MSDLAQRFAAAQARIKPITGLMMDLRGRAKYDAWAKHKGMTKDAAMEAYIALVAKHTPSA